MNKSSRLAASVVVAVLAGSITPATADRDIVIETPGERSTSNKLVLAGLAGAGVLAAGFGAYWHLDSRSHADAVAANKFTGMAWTPDDAAHVDAADRSRTRAIVAYGLGAALIVGAAAVLIATDPPSETVVITPKRAKPTVNPVPGGAVLGARWRF